MALGIDGLRVGTWTHPDATTGVTVLLPPDGTLGAIAVRGQSPGTREAAALGPSGKLAVCHAVVLAGGSAHGLAAADGVMGWLEEQGTGYALPNGALVPIVGAAIVLDGSVATPGGRPDAAAGRAACAAATTREPDEGRVGAGTGCTVAKVGGLQHARPGGQGVAVERAGQLVVAALVVNNAAGEVVAADGSTLVGSTAPADAPRWPRDTDRPGEVPTDPVVRAVDGNAAAIDGDVASSQRDAAAVADTTERGGGPTANTVIGAVVTNALLDKVQAHRVADLAHDGVARAIEPAHTSVDGDAIFCLATGRVRAPLDLVTQLAVAAVARATRRGPTEG